jgi:hypothetical protein
MGKDKLTEIASHHDKWVRTVEGFGVGYYAEDIVQEMYMTLVRTNSIDKAFRDGKLYVGFIYICLRNACVNYNVKKSRVQKVDIDETNVTRDDIILEGRTTEQKIEFEELSNEIRETLRNEHWYYEKVYDIYTSPDAPSYRQMARDTTISFMTIYGDMKKIKHLIKSNKKFETKWKKNQE